MCLIVLDLHPAGVPINLLSFLRLRHEGTLKKALSGGGSYRGK